jgi:hypothetical protein
MLQQHVRFPSTTPAVTHTTHRRTINVALTKNIGNDTRMLGQNSQSFRRTDRGNFPFRTSCAVNRGLPCMSL